VIAFMELCVKNLNSVNDLWTSIMFRFDLPFPVDTRGSPLPAINLWPFCYDGIQSKNKTD
jgi:hypothetical protein